MPRYTFRSKEKPIHLFESVGTGSVSHIVHQQPIAEGRLQSRVSRNPKRPDYTDYWHHPMIAVGGPIERRQLVVAPTIEPAKKRGKVRQIRSEFLERQQREVGILKKMYETWPVGEEQHSIRASRLAEQFGTPPSHMDRFSRTLDSAGIISRRLSFRRSADGKRGAGREYHWTLNLPLETALIALEKAHEKERKAADHPQAPRKRSMKMRMYDAIRDQGKFDTIKDLLRAIEIPGERNEKENLGFHHMTHELNVLRGEGRIKFDVNGADEVINITLSKAEEKGRIAPPPQTGEFKPISLKPLQELRPVTLRTDDYKRGDRVWVKPMSRFAEVTGVHPTVIDLRYDNGGTATLSRQAISRDRPAKVKPMPEQKPKHRAEAATVVTPARPVPEIEKPVIDIAKQITGDWKEFPLTMELLKKIKNRETLELAAKAVEGVDDELALMILDRATVNPTPEQNEMLKLYGRLQECRETQT